MIRLGLCCKFANEPIRFRTTTVSYLKKIREKGNDPLLHINEILKNNVLALAQAISFCIDKGIGSFRVGSDFFPAVTHPDTQYWLEDLSEGEQLKKDLAHCGENAKKNNIRLTFHPSQFVLLTALDKEIIKKSLADLEYHALFADLIGADVINIHGGGGYNDKPKALKRFSENFQHLSKTAKKYLTIENDDRVYTPSDLLDLCARLKIPFVYDVHHHRCLKDQLSIEETTNEALKTWDREPLFHVSSPINGWDGKTPHRHHDYIDIADVPECWSSVNPLTIDIEAKAKEKAVLALKKKLADKNWPLYL